MPDISRRPREHTARWAVAAVVAAVVCCASIPLLVTFGAGAVLATVVATVCKPEVLLPVLAVLIVTAAVALVRRLP